MAELDVSGGGGTTRIPGLPAPPLTWLLEEGEMFGVAGLNPGRGAEFASKAGGERALPLLAGLRSIGFCTRLATKIQKLPSFFIFRGVLLFLETVICWQRLSQSSANRFPTVNVVEEEMEEKKKKRKTQKHKKGNKKCHR